MSNKSLVSLTDDSSDDELEDALLNFDVLETESERRAVIPKHVVHGGTQRGHRKINRTEHYRRRRSTKSTLRSKELRAAEARSMVTHERVVKLFSRLWHRSTNGMGGGAGSWLVFLVLMFPVFPMFAVVKGLNLLHYITIMFLSTPVFLYALGSMPVFFGWLFGWCLSNLGPLNGYPLVVDSISVHPHIESWELHVQVVVRNFRFGNPPGFPFENFISVRRLDFAASVPFSHVLNFFLQRTIPVPLRDVPDFQRCAKIDFNHIEAEGVMCNFQMCDGKFNITEFTRLIAAGETKRVLAGKPAPNQIRFNILRATDLTPHRLKTVADPYVEVRVRRQHKSTKTQAAVLDPMWNEELVFHNDDPSVVLEVSVFDRDAPNGSQGHLIGHWAMTSKYLITDPKFCWHEDKGFECYRGKDGYYGFKGWVPLATKEWKEMGLRGSLHLDIRWEYVPEDLLECPYTPTREYTALEQLTQTSYEDRLRFGDWSRFRHWLQHEPYLFDVRRFTVRDIQFYLQDLFTGYSGKAENLNRAGKQPKDANAVRIEKLEYRSRFRPKGGDPGITTYDVFVNFFTGLAPKFVKSGRIGGTVFQIVSGSASNVGTQVKSFFTGKFDRTKLPGAKKNIKKIGKQAKSGFEVLHRKHTQNPRNLRQFKHPVTAQDSDFLLDQVELLGYLERCAIKVTGGEVLDDQDMLQYLGRKGKFKCKYFELKGSTLFFRKHRSASNSTYNLTYKIDLALVKSIIYVSSANEVLLNQAEIGCVVRLRLPKKLRTEIDNKLVDIGGNTPLEKWVQEFRDRGLVVQELDDVPEDLL